MMEVTFEITKEIAVIGEHATGWRKELNMVAWNGNPAKYDIRDWSPDHSQMGRGITLTEAEMMAIVDALSDNGSEDKGEPEEPERAEEEGVSEEGDEPSPDLSIKYDTGEMNVNIVQFITNRNLTTLKALVNKVIKIAHNREEVLEASTYWAKKMVEIYAPSGLKREADWGRKAGRFLEYAGKIA